MLAVEGVGWVVNDFEALWADAASRELLLQLIEWTESVPALMGASTHLLAVGRKPRRG